LSRAVRGLLAMLKDRDGRREWLVYVISDINLVEVKFLVVTKPLTVILLLVVVRDLIGIRETHKSLYLSSPTIHHALIKYYRGTSA
jgi:hypothetical protein